MKCDIPDADWYNSGPFFSSKFNTAVIEDGVSSIGKHAFQDCSSITTLSLPSTLKSIGEEAFCNCSGFTELTLPVNIESFGNKAFYGCGGVVYLNCNLPDTNEGIFRDSKITRLIVGNGVTSLGQSSFCNSSQLASVTLPSSLETIGNYAFESCKGLTSITIPSSVRNISKYAFKNCEGLTDKNSTGTVYVKCDIPDADWYNSGPFFSSKFNTAVIEEGVDIIGNHAFQDCSSITTLSLPSTLKSIGEEAFCNCSGFTDIYCYAGNAPETGNNAFANSSIATATLHVPPTAISTYGSIVPWSSASSIVAGDDNGGGQSDDDTGDNIIFADANVKALCVQNWDTNGDGELSKAEAAAVKSIGKVFYLGKIASFDELCYFTGLTAIEEQAFFQSNITSVTIPSGVTSIGNSAFSYCNNLTSLTLPDGLSSIEAYAFFCCWSLTSIYIPRSLTSIDSSTFSACKAISTIIVDPENSVYDSRDNCNAIIRKSDNTIVYGCKNTVIPTTVTAIGIKAFSSTDGLTDVIIPDNVTLIDDYSYSACDSLRTVTIGSGIKEINKWAFHNCKSLKNFYCNATTPPTTSSDVFDDSPISSATLHVPEGTVNLYKTTAPWSGFGSIVAIGEDDVEEADKACINGIYYNFLGDEAEVTYKDENYWSYSGYVTIPPSVNYKEKNYRVTRIGEKAFYQCGELKSVKIDTSVTSIGDYAFSGCNNMPSVDIPNSVTSIGIGAFEDCYKLTSVTIPNGVTSISKSLFNNCEALTAVTLPNGVKDIGESAFAYCGKLTTVNIPEGVKNIGKRAFANCSVLTSLLIPKSVTDIGDGAFHQCYNLVSVNIPEGVTSINSSVFNTCRSLTAITIPNSVTSIGVSAFLRCQSLTSIIIPNNVTFIDEGAFSQCSGLTSVTISKGVTDIGIEAFEECTSLTDVYCYAETVPTTNYSAFKSSPIAAATLHVPAGSVNLYESTSPWSGFGSIVAIGEEVPAGEFLGAKRIFADNLLKSSTYDDKTFTYQYDNNGFVTQIDRNSSSSSRTYTISYGDKITFNCSDGTKWVATLNSSGFVGSMVRYKEDGSESDHVVFTYNADDQLTGVYYDDDEFFNITYSGGDIIQCMFSRASGYNNSWTYSYETSSQDMILNTGNVMEFDNIYGVDLDDYNLLYYIGALGKATKHLPLAGVVSGSTITGTWTTDDAGRAIQGTFNNHTLTWNWDNNGSGQGGEDPNPMLLGTWRYDFDTNSYILLTFSQDETVHYKEYDKGGWQHDEFYSYSFSNNALKITDSDGNVKGVIEVLTLTSTTLKLNGWPDGGVSTFTKQNDSNIESAVLNGSIIGQWNIVSGSYTRYENDVQVSQEAGTLTPPYDKIVFYDNGTLEYWEYSSSSDSYHEDGQGTYTIEDNKFVYGGGDWDNFIITSFDGNNMEVYVQFLEDKGSTVVRKVTYANLQRVTDDDEPVVTKCATPFIANVDGKLMLCCETEDVEYVCNIGFKNDGNILSLPNVITISVYATKDGYEPSDSLTLETTPKVLLDKFGDVNGDGIVNGTDIQEIINIIISN